MKRIADAHWAGSAKDGKGTLSTQSTVLSQTSYSFHSRFEDGTGTNPEELIAAAHAGCYSMKLSFVLAEKGFASEVIDTKATLNFVAGVVTGIHLETVATVPGLSAEQFAEAAEDARANCPISQLLKTEITLDATLA